LVENQERLLDSYLTGLLSIRGFAVNKGYELGPPILYDGHLLGITETVTGKGINELPVQALCQLKPERAGFVPSGYPHVPFKRTIIENGIVIGTEMPCVDYRSLWSLNGCYRLVEGICPRDGSGYAPAKFATDGETTAVSHGDHPGYILDIRTKKSGEKEKIRRIDLDPRKIPLKLFIRDGHVFGYHPEGIMNYSTEKMVFSSPHRISSISDSGLCTLSVGDQTHVFDYLRNKRVDSLKGDYVFLSSTRQ
jgi:hypothetical protein